MEYYLPRNRSCIEALKAHSAWWRASKYKGNNLQVIMPENSIINAWFTETSLLHILDLSTEVTLSTRHRNIQLQPSFLWLSSLLTQLSHILVPWNEPKLRWWRCNWQPWNQIIHWGGAPEWCIKFLPTFLSSPSQKAPRLMRIKSS